MNDRIQRAKERVKAIKERVKNLPTAIRQEALDEVHALIDLAEAKLDPNSALCQILQKVEDALPATVNAFGEQQPLHIHAAGESVPAPTIAAPIVTALRQNSAPVTISTHQGGPTPITAANNVGVATVVLATPVTDEPVSVVGDEQEAGEVVTGEILTDGEIASPTPLEGTRFESA